MKGPRVEKRGWGNRDIFNFASDQPKTISWRVAEIWSVWSRWSISFVWFDEPERQDRPAHQIDCL
jgi:hypothetical protein